jgi:hypothetical protein
LVDSSRLVSLELLMRETIDFGLPRCSLRVGHDMERAAHAWVDKTQIRVVSHRRRHVDLPIDCRRLPTVRVESSDAA